MKKEIIETEINNYFSNNNIKRISLVVENKDYILSVKGLTNPMINEVVVVNGKHIGVIIQFDNIIGKVCLYERVSIEVGSSVEQTGKEFEVGFSDKLLGRVVDALGTPIDGEGEIDYDCYAPVERIAQPLIDRVPVDVSIKTGILSIDTTIPIGRGQRELIIGDRETGKTQIALDTIINQRDSGVISIYVAIGQKTSKIKAVYQQMYDNGVAGNCVIVAANSNATLLAKHLVPYAATSIAEEFMKKGKDVLIIYDDLSIHADTYRSLSLMLENPPGREAYPGDIFYLHSRLLERSCNLERGSITSLPIVQTEEDDITGYIATNVIGITDGQIFTNTELFKKGFKPAIDIGLSVSRVGGDAQTQMLKIYSKGILSDYIKFKNIEKNSFSGMELIGKMKKDKERGQILEKLFIQNEQSALSEVEKLILLHLYKTTILTLENCDEYRQKVKEIPSEIVDIFEADITEEEAYKLIEEIVGAF